LHTEYSKRAVAGKLATLYFRRPNQKRDPLNPSAAPDTCSSLLSSFELRSILRSHPSQKGNTVIFTHPQFEIYQSIEWAGRKCMLREPALQTPAYCTIVVRSALIEARTTYLRRCFCVEAASSSRSLTACGWAAILPLCFPPPPTTHPGSHTSIGKAIRSKHRHKHQALSTSIRIGPHEDGSLSRR
jgi:hypothetical protein